MWQDVDPFIGTARTDLPAPMGLAATWWSAKPQVGNTHPGATYPLGMVSACPYSGAYPTGYGCYDLSTEGDPGLLHDELVASGVTHFHQSGTGAIRKYYNYVRVTPMIQPLDDLGTTWKVTEEQAQPGYYSALLASGVRVEVTVGPKSAVHRYTFPEHHDARLVLDLSHGGLTIPYGTTVPLRAHVQALGHGRAEAVVVMEGVPVAVHVEADVGDWQQMLWHDRRLMPGGARLELDHIRSTTLRPFGLLWRGPATAGQVVEVRLGFSLRGPEQARANLERDTDGASPGFELRRAQTATDWAAALGAVQVRTVVPAAAHGLLHRPLPLPHQAVPGPRREPVLAGGGALRVRRLHDVGHLPHPAAPAGSTLPRACRRARAGTADRVRGRGEPAHRLPHGQGRRPVLAAGQRPGPHLPGRPVPSRGPRHRLGLGAEPDGARPAPHGRGRTSWCAGSPTR